MSQRLFPASPDAEKALLGCMLIGGPDVIEEVAAALGVSERSLRRQLGEEGSSFRALVDDVRYVKARQLLGEGRLPVEAIAQQLGYSEAAAFIHAFKRWAGQSPTAYREALPGGRPHSAPQPTPAQAA